MISEDSRSPGTAPDVSAPRLRVSVLTDDRLFAEAVVRLFDSDTAYAAEWNGAAGDAVIEHAGVVLLDSRIPEALACCDELAHERRVPVILVAAPDDEAWALEAITAGARGILKRNASGADVLCALGAVCNGVIWAPRRVISALLDRLASGTGGPPAQNALLEQRLSIREREIFHHAARGLGNKELAVRLEISEATVKVHLTHIFRKLGVRCRSELAAAYFGVTSAVEGVAIAPPLTLREDRVASVFSPSANAIIRKS